MVSIEEIQAAYYMVAATGVLVAAAYYVMNVRAMQKTSKQTLETRQAQLFMGIYQGINKEMALALTKINVDVKGWDDFDSLCKDNEWYATFNSVAIFFEGIGVLVREGLVDVRLPSLLISGAITGFWQKWGSYIVQAREKWGFPRWCIEAEYLSDRITEYGRKHPELKIVPNL